MRMKTASSCVAAVLACSALGPHEGAAQLSFGSGNLMLGTPKAAVIKAQSARTWH